MLDKLFKNYIYPMSIFSGSMIGVGFLSLPYVAAQSGILLTLIYFFVLTFIVLLIDLIFCDISLKTPDYKRFPGFVGYYLGKKAQLFAILISILGSFGVLLAYLIIGSEFLSEIINSVTPVPQIFCAIIYFLVASAIIFFDMKTVAKVEMWIIISLFVSIFLIFIGSWQDIKLGNILGESTINLKNIFLPYGPLLFALWGIGMIPEIEEMISGNKKNLKKIITISTIITSLFYFLFVIIILSIAGKDTDPTALSGIKGHLNNNLFIVPLFIGVIATFTAFVTQGIIFKKVLVLDLKIKHWQAFIITCATPMILFLLGMKSFLIIISLIGGVILGINGIFIIMMYRKIYPRKIYKKNIIFKKRLLEYWIGRKNILIIPLVFVFIMGAIYEIINFIR